jgi:hypothetical protein
MSTRQAAAKKTKRPYEIGSSFDSWLREDGIYEEVTANAEQRLEARFKLALSAGEWISSEMLSHSASDWKREGLIFSVVFEGKEYFPRYEFDALYQPLPVIRDVLKGFGPVVDSWKIAAWFHYPNGWIVEPGPEGLTPVAPKDALDRRENLLNAIKKRQGSYIA